MPKFILQNLKSIFKYKKKSFNKLDILILMDIHLKKIAQILEIRK